MVDTLVLNDQQNKHSNIKWYKYYGNFSTQVLVDVNIEII